MAGMLARYLDYGRVKKAERAPERKRAQQQRIKDHLDTLYGHLVCYIALLDELVRTMEIVEGEDAVLGAARTVEVHEILRRELWLALWLAFIDDDASGIDVMPIAMDELAELVKAGRVQLHKLDGPSDERRRQCAMLTAQIYDKHGVLAGRWGLEEIPYSPL